MRARPRRALSAAAERSVVGIAYGSDLERAREVIADAVGSVDRVVSTPEPQVLFQGFGESSLDFRVLFWVGDFDDGLGAQSQVGLSIQKALKDAGFEIPFPQRDLHLKGSVDTDPARQPDGRDVS